MKNINERMLDVSRHLQSLATPEYSLEIKDAVERNDRASLIKVCKKAKVPSSYVGTVVSAILSVQPQKWPMDF
jgi:hypothetical protein